jgi:hypothetical protein
MKVILLFSVFIILFSLVSPISAQTVWKSEDVTVPKKIPQYLLVIRYWGSVVNQEGDVMTFDQGWIYLKETYSSVDEILKRLQTYAGPGMSKKQSENELIGVWKLGESNNIANELFQLEEVRHEKEVKIETREWIEHKWSIKQPKEEQK